MIFHIRSSAAPTGDAAARDAAGSAGTHFLGPV